MNVAFQALLQNAASKLATAELGLFKAGQILQALVVGQTASGLTQLKIGDVLIEAQLPQPAQPGTMLQLQVKAGGAAPQLVLVSQQNPAVTLPEVARMPLPMQMANVVLPEAEAVPLPQALAQGTAPQGMAQQPTAPAPVAVQPLPQPAVQGQPVPQATVQPQSAPVALAAAQVLTSAPSVPPPQIVQPQTVIAPQGQAVTAPTSQIESAVPMPIGAPPVVATNGPAAQPQAPAIPQQVVAQPATVPAPVVAEVPVAQQPPTPQAAPLAPLPSQPQPLPQVPFAPMPAAPIVVQSQPQPAAPQAAVVADMPELAAVSPLLVAQAAPKVPQTVAELPRFAPAPGQVAPASPQPLPATPEQAVAQMAPEAMAKQNSVAPLLQSLAAVIAKPVLLPEPIIRAALQVLAQQIAVPDGKVQAAGIERAVARSGVFLEAGLARATPVPGDAKAALNNLKAVLEKFLGGAPPANPPNEREAPPLKGVPPRAMAMEMLPLPDGARDVARALHSQTDAAISRVKLGQLAGLPDAPNAARPGQQEFRMELPFLIGHELVMAQLQIAQDGRRHETNRKRGWTMRFAMNFSQTGEVGAEIGLLGKSVNVALWAAEPETAEALSAALPELARALEALGLDPGPVRIRSSVPEAPKIASGHFVDAMT